MKKLGIGIIILIMIALTLPINGQSKENNNQDYEVIPDDAIRLRILANSDNDKDQQIKQAVRDNVNAAITEWVAHITDIEEARTLLENRIPEISEIVKQTLEEQGENRDFDVEYNDSVSFPTKIYGSYLYPAGEYEAILITIGEGDGSNWWCVLFPPLCFLDFASGISVADASPGGFEEEAEQDTGLKIKFFLLEWLGLS
ncbi:stage II sporulation protein R [Ornithinibacillus halotolerans]|uniref:Stage II sporulation protein R n=1 Tax=Ornithinibacillus halotolerans TaxID=1274357 RepID=A0A916W432_9BACI|nr:stage II sporulation protein R [Ornithinibacillus halotolerans]GGA64207.1 stage II sporulation protein R [Ornithinibacillus halotolerans]